jgi:hypothetical protein
VPPSLPRLVYEALDKAWPFGTFSDHVRRLAEKGVLEECYREPRRGATDPFYGRSDESTRSRQSHSTSNAEDRLARLAARLGLELPALLGPLVAFELAKERSRGDPLHLGGDLHAVHPEATSASWPVRRDGSLDSARVTLTAFDHDPLETTALEGVWCLAVPGELRDSVPYLAISDTDGRLRTWILLPQFGLTPGLVHLWLPAVPAPPKSRCRPAGPPPGAW